MAAHSVRGHLFSLSKKHIGFDVFSFLKTENYIAQLQKNDKIRKNQAERRKAEVFPYANPIVIVEDDESIRTMLDYHFKSLN